MVGGANEKTEKKVLSKCALASFAQQHQGYFTPKSYRLVSISKFRHP
jgi:hypothetical protein